MIPASLFHPREADIIKGIDIASTLEPVETHLCGTSVTKQKKKNKILQVPNDRFHNFTGAAAPMAPVLTRPLLFDNGISIKSLKG